MIKIIFLDVDGCLSDGGLYYSQSGDEMKRFDVKDGFAIQEWIKMGGKVAIITGKISKIVENRAKELGIKYVFQGVKDKFAQAVEILRKEKLGLDECAAIGDDLNDICLLSKVKMSFCPNDASKFINANIRLNSCGGRGAVREMIEIIMQENGTLQEWVKKWS